MRYHPPMSSTDDMDDTPRPPPAHWLAALEESDADLAAGRTVPLEPVLARLRESIERMEGRQATQGTKATHRA